METLNSLVYYDKQLLLFLHSKGSPAWDYFWIFITEPLHWIPLFFVLFFFEYKVIGLKKTFLTTIITIVSGATSLVIVNSIKNYIQRERPINDVSINSSIRVIVEQSDFSFVSGHSAVSFTVTFISYWILKNNYRYAFLLFIFPMLFAYSRIYLALHFPIDIFFGMFLGFGVALIFYKIMQFFILNR